MLHKFFCGVLIAILLLSAGRSHAQLQEAQQLALNIEKLAQFKKILSDMYDAYKILSQGYNKVKDITSGNYSIHQVFLDGLMAVSPSVRNYRRIPDIISGQASILKEYRSAFSRFKDAGVFSPSELGYLGNVYQGLLNRSIDNVSALTLILTAGSLRMTDDERLTAIDRLATEIEDQLSFLRAFNDKTGVFALQRLREKRSLQTTQKLYNIKP